MGNLNHKVILKKSLILISAQSRVTKVLTNGSPSSRGLLLLKKNLLGLYQSFTIYCKKRKKTVIAKTTKNCDH